MLNGYARIAPTVCLELCAVDLIQGWQNPIWSEEILKVVGLRYRGACYPSEISTFCNFKLSKEQNPEYKPVKPYSLSFFIAIIASSSTYWSFLLPSLLSWDFSTFGVCQQQVTATVSYFPRFVVVFVYSPTRSIVLQSVGL